MNILSDHNVIVEKIRKGDLGSFEMLFKEYYRNLCYYAENLLREKAAAEEVVSDFFMKLWENRASLEIRQSLKAYMYSSIRNNCIKNLEHLKVLQKYRQYATFTLQNIDLLAPEASQPLSGMISREILENVEKAIEALPEHCREVFNLSRFENCSYDEIAQRLNISKNTVRTQMTRALQKLRDSLKEYLP